MLNLFKAEWMKISKNYALTGFLVWIYPIGLGSFFAIAIFSSAFSNSIQKGMVATSSGQWTTDMLGIWIAITSFPANIFPRMLPLAFMAVVFANEYQWGMWKNLIPRARRTPLILSKLAMLILVVWFSLLVTSFVIGIGQALTHKAVDAAYGPTFTTETVVDFLPDYLRDMTLAMASLTVLAGYAALAVLLTRSVLGGLLIGFGLSILEPISLQLLLLASRLLDNASLVNLYRFTPTYNIDNLRSWFMNDAALTQIIPDFTVEPSLVFSTFLLGAWIIGLVGITVGMFRRQDISS